MLKRSLAILASTAVLAFLVVPDAQASPPDDLKSYAGGSSAAALALTLLGQQIAVSTTSSAVGSVPEPTAAADGAALLLAGTAVPGAAPSRTPDGAPANEACPLPIDLSALVTGISIDIACVTTTATVTDEAPDASSETEEVLITVNGLGGPVLEPVLEAVLGPILDGIEGPLDDLCEQLAVLGLCELVDDTLQIDLDGLIDEILAGLAELENGAFTLLEIAVAPTYSHSSASDEDGVVAEAGSTGVSIRVLPGLASIIQQLTGLIPGAPGSLLTVTLGNATARVVRDPQTGAASTDGSAAQLLDVSLTDNLGIISELLGTTVPDLLDSLTEPLAALSCDGGALADVVCVDLGAFHELDAAGLASHGYEYGEGTVGVEASAANIQVLPILAEALGGDVLSVSLATASAAANAFPDAVDRPRGDPPVPPLPKTGGENTMPIGLALFAAATAGVAIVRRTRSV